MQRVVPWLSLSFSVLLALVGCDASAVGPRRDAGGGDGGGGPVADEDGDGISDADEGRREDRDTDGDGTPDYLDDDSDGDGIPDAVEAGDTDPRTPPRDGDMDGTPDFIDLDADGNGIPDRDEIPGDVDGDGTENFADLDDDDDGIRDDLELLGMDIPVDTDGDGLADYQDRDSDNDTIMDGHERDADTDGDMTLDLRDLDSDADGIPDATEAGDADLDTQPVDTDMDGIPDFRDPDSDNDGLSDADEVAGGSSPTTADTDGDGVSDLIEVGAGTSPTDASDSPRTRGDFVFVVPYMEDPDPARDTLTFRTSIQFADVYFLFDASGSMGGEQDGLAAGVSTIMSNLTCADSGVACTRDAECGSGEICSPFSASCIEDPGASSCVLSVWTGAGQYGQSAGSGNRLINRRSLQPDPAATSTAIAAIPEDGGTEPLYGAVWAVVDPLTAAMAPPTGGSVGNVGCEPAMAGRIGCPAYREEAVRILVAFTDEDSDLAVTAAQAGGALTTANVTFIGVWSGSASSSARQDMVDLANASGSVDSSGAPLVFNASTTGAGIDAVVTNAINEIVEGVPLRVTIGATDEPDDAGDALQFIAALETNTVSPGCTAVAVEDSDGDGITETFPSVTPGTPVCWDVVPERNTFVMPATSPLVFKARLTVYGDGSPLDSRLVYFLVPPRVEIPVGPG